MIKFANSQKIQTDSYLRKKWSIPSFFSLVIHEKKKDTEENHVEIARLFVPFVPLIRKVYKDKYPIDKYPIDKYPFDK